VEFSVQLTLTRMAFAAVLHSAVIPAHAQGVNQSLDTVLGGHAPYETVIRAFQAGVTAHDAAAVAALVRYPITVRAGGKKLVVRNAATFVRNYDAIVTPPIAQAITAQKYDELMVNGQGVMFGSGEAWINGVCLDAACKRVDPKVVTIQAAPKP